MDTEGLELCQAGPCSFNPFHLSVVGWRGDQTFLHLPGGGNIYQGYGGNVTLASLQSVPGNLSAALSSLPVF